MAVPTSTLGPPSQILFSGMKLATHRLIQMLRMSGAMFLFPLYVFVAQTETNLPDEFYISFNEDEACNNVYFYDLNF
jgi:hypothetical protein